MKNRYIVESRLATGVIDVVESKRQCISAARGAFLPAQLGYCGLPRAFPTWPPPNYRLHDAQPAV